MSDRLAIARARAGTVTLAVATAGLGVLLALRLFAFGEGRYVLAALALVPYLAACGLVLTCACLMLRRWRIAGVAGVLTIVLVATLLPRLLPNEQPHAGGATVRLMALNLHFGRADAAEVVAQVRAHDVDVLSLLELTPTAVFDLQEAGLFDLLPHQTLRPAEGGGGVGIAASHTLDPWRYPARAGYAATVRLPGRSSVDVVAVHTLEPLTTPAKWRSNLAGLAAAGAGENTRPRILAGDFNATLDHAALRDVLDSGYVDAAAQRGEGLSPTWPNAAFPPPVAIDHILVERLGAVRDYETLDITGSDHDAVYAEVSIPR